MYVKYFERCSSSGSDARRFFWNPDDREPLTAIVCYLSVAKVTKGKWEGHPDNTRQGWFTIAKKVDAEIT
eukprot:10630914-Prorocentrum_lima.AAC.1